MYERTTNNNVGYEQTIVNDNVKKNEAIDTRSSSFLGKVYGYLAIALLITFAFAFGFSYLLKFIFTFDEEVAVIVAITGIVVSFIVMLVCSIIISVLSFRKKKSIVVPGIIYSIAMGMMLSYLVLVSEAISPWLFPSAIAVTAAAYGIMYFIGRGAKNLNWIAMVGLSILAGCSLASLVFGTLYILTVFNVELPLELRAGTILLYWGIDLGVFIVMVLFTTFDMWRINKIAKSGMHSNNLALFCAFMLYQRFVNIFMRILRILIRLLPRK